MRNSWWVLILMLVPDIADAFPRSFTYNGRLERAGGAYDGALEMRFSLCNQVSGGTCYSEQKSVQISAGTFSVELGAVSDPTLLGITRDPRYTGASTSSSQMVK